MQWIWLMSMGAPASCEQLAFVYALKYGNLSTLFPYEFLKLIWAIAIGVLLFGEAFEWNILIGSSIIVFATAYVTWRNAIKTKHSSDYSGVKNPQCLDLLQNKKPRNYFMLATIRHNP